MSQPKTDSERRSNALKFAAAFGFAADDGSNVRILLDDVEGDPFMNKFAAWPFR